MPSSPINLPAGYAPAFAIGFSEAGVLSVVDTATPLPVQTMNNAAAPALQGTTGSSAVVGPFAPSIGRTVILSLSGIWTGSVRLLRSTDGGATKLPVTAGGYAWGTFTANACEQVWLEEEAGAALYLDVALTSGTVTYRLAQ